MFEILQNLLTSLLTSKISGCMCPMTGLAPASRIRGGQLDGPGPNKRRLGTARGFFSRSGGSTAREAILAAVWRSRSDRELSKRRLKSRLCSEHPFSLASELLRLEFNMVNNILSRLSTLSHPRVLSLLGQTAHMGDVDLSSNVNYWLPVQKKNKNLTALVDLDKMAEMLKCLFYI